MGSSADFKVAESFADHSANGRKRAKSGSPLEIRVGEKKGRKKSTIRRRGEELNSNTSN